MHRSETSLAHGVEGALLAVGAQGRLFQVDPFDGVGGSHGAGIVVAVREIDGMSDLVNGFLDEAVEQEIGVWRKSVKLLAQAMEGDDGARTSHLGFAEDKRQNGDVKIGGRDAEHAPCAAVRVFLHGLKNFGRMMLSALRMESDLGIEPLVENTDRDAKGIGERQSETVQESRVEVSDGQQIEHLVHRVAFTISLSGLDGAAPAILFQLMMQSYTIDVERFRRAGLVKATFFKDAQDVSLFHVFQ